MATVEHYLDRYLDPVAEALSPQAAQRILDLRPEPEVVARVQELAEKSMPERFPKTSWMNTELWPTPGP